MRDSGLITGALAIMGAAGLAAYLYLGQSNAQSASVSFEDTEGPNLVIEVSGTANGSITIDLLSDVAPLHVEQITALAEEGAYDGVIFHRVIDGFMAQTGDVEFGKIGGDTVRAGMGGSSRPNIPAEFSDLPFQRGVVGMARSASPDSANSQFFIMFEPATHLNGQYTVVGRVIEGMDVVDAIKKGSSQHNGAVLEPDQMAHVTVVK